MAAEPIRAQSPFPRSSGPATLPAWADFSPSPKSPYNGQGFRGSDPGINFESLLTTLSRFMSVSDIPTRGGPECSPHIAKPLPKSALITQTLAHSMRPAHARR